MDIDYKTILTEIGTFENAGITNFLDILPDPDIILLKRGDDARILEDIASDEQVTQCMINRKYRVLLNERYAFKPGVAGAEQPTPAADFAHKMLVEDLENTVIYDIFSALLDAPFYGYSALEILWEPRDGYYRIKNIIARPYEWFAFNGKSELVFRGESAFTGNIVPKGKFIISRHFPTFKNPYGLRLLSRCLWPVVFKKGGVKFFARFLEKYGIPWAVAYAPTNAGNEEKARMARDLASMVQDATAVLPAGSSLQLHSATANQADIFEIYINRWDKAISKILTGQTLTSDIGDSGSYAASQTHKDVSDDMAQADRQMVTSVMNELAWMYTQINFKGVAAPTFSYIDDEDLTARADLDKKLYDMGVSFKPDYIEQTYGIGKKYFTIREPQSFIPPSFSDQKADKANELILNNNQETLDSAAHNLAAQLAEKANIANEDLKKAIENASDLEELEDSLAGLGLDYKAVDEIIKNVLINSAAFGYTSSLGEPSAGSPSRAPFQRKELTSTKRGSSTFNGNKQ